MVLRDTSDACSYNARGLCQHESSVAQLPSLPRLSRTVFIWCTLPHMHPNMVKEFHHNFNILYNINTFQQELLEWQRSKLGNLCVHIRRLP